MDAKTQFQPGAMKKEKQRLFSRFTLALFLMALAFLAAVVILRPAEIRYSAGESSGGRSEVLDQSPIDPGLSPALDHQPASSSSESDPLATNPELRIHQRLTEAGTGIGESEMLAANPELSAARRFASERKAGGESK